MTKLTDIVGIGPALSKLLADHNIKTVNALSSISMSKLLEVPGFSELRARATIKAAAKCLHDSGVVVSARKTSRSQTTLKKRTTGKATIVKKAAVRPDAPKEKDKKKKNKKSDKKKHKNKKAKGKGKGKK